MSSGTWSLSASLLDLTTIQVRHGKPSLVNEGRRLHRRLVHAVALKSGTNLRPGYLNPITGLTPTERYVDPLELLLEVNIDQTKLYQKRKGRFI